VELKDFVRATLEQIVEGTAAAQEAIQEKGGLVNPANVQYRKDGAWNSYEDAVPQDVVFDVALTATDKRGSSEGIGVFLGSISLGKKNEAGIEHVAITKVRFSVPLVLPSAQRPNT
jgi:hypothetical protein